MAALGGEVITLQLGPYANCVGAHWWSLQEVFRQSEAELRRDVLLRRGRGLQGADTYTPRLIAVDIKGSGQVEVDLYDEEEKALPGAPAWTGSVTTHRQDHPPQGPQLMRVEEGPRPQRETFEPSVLSRGGAGRTGDGGSAVGGGGVSERGCDALWSDYLRTPLHPKSLCILSHRNHGGVSSLESFSQGQSLLRTAPHLDEVEDRLHFFSEECDYLQGFHLLCDTHNGFSGAGSKMAELLRDEYPGRGIIAFGTCPMPLEGQDLHSRTYQLMNYLLSLAAISDHASIFCPLTVRTNLGLRPGPPAAFPQLLYHAAWPYHSSAVLAVTLDTVTVPYRLSAPSLTLTHLADALSFSGRKVLTASCSLPFPLGSASSLPDTLLPHVAAPPWRGLSACVDSAPIFSQSVILRGIPPERQTSCLQAGTRPLSPLHTCPRGEEVLQTYLAALHPGTLSVSHLLGAPCALGPTFPQFFSRYITKDGCTLEEPMPAPAVVGGAPVMAALRAPSSLHHSLLALCDELTKMDVRRWANFSTAGVEDDDFREAVESVRTLAHLYRP